MLRSVSFLNPYTILHLRDTINQSFSPSPRNAPLGAWNFCTTSALKQVTTALTLARRHVLTVLAPKIKH